MEKKQWWKSSTIWFSVASLIGVFAPKYAPIIPDLVNNVAQIVGPIGAIISRFRPNIKEVVLMDPNK